uniref:Uncharacterized protein n=1 Tax=Octopus bimaculoides TaxID=37653 RepID=A0A0L8GBV1_OCTBM
MDHKDDAFNYWAYLLFISVFELSFSGMKHNNQLLILMQCAVVLACGFQCFHNFVTLSS